MEINVLPNFEVLQGNQFWLRPILFCTGLKMPILLSSFEGR